MAWVHRITGAGLVVFALVHIQTVALLSDPAAYSARMETFSGPVILFLEWCLAIPVMLHALNGGRLILFESFSMRNDSFLIRSVLIGTGLYVLLLAVLMILGDQAMTPVGFWLPALTLALVAVWGLALRLKGGGLPLTFILQRLTGIFLLIMIPAHLLFMHLSPEASQAVEAVRARVGQGLIKVADGALVVALIYHAAQGLASIVADYLTKGLQRYLVSALLIAILAWSGWQGLALLGRI